MVKIKKRRIIAGIMPVVLAMIFIAKFLAIELDWQEVTVFFGIDPSNNFLKAWFLFGGLVLIGIGIMICTSSVSILSILVLAGYGVLQLIGLSITIIYASAGYEDNYIGIDTILYLVNIVLSFTPLVIICTSD